MILRWRWIRFSAKPRVQVIEFASSVRNPTGGATASPGIDLVSLLRGTEIFALAIYDDIDITREQLFKIGQGKDTIRKGSSNKNLRIFRPKPCRR
jgi:hypothetical protein